MVVIKFRLRTVVLILNNTAFHEFSTRDANSEHLCSTRLLRSSSTDCKTGPGRLLVGSGGDDGHVTSSQLKNLTLKNGKSLGVEIVQQFVARRTLPKSVVCGCQLQLIPNKLYVGQNHVGS